MHNSNPININMPSKGCMLSKGQGYMTQFLSNSYSDTFNVFELNEVIKKEEATTLMKMSLYESGAKEPPRRRKVRERERRIQTLFQRFNGGNISIDLYLESFKHHTGL